MKIKRANVPLHDEERFQLKDVGPRRPLEMICDILPYVGQIISPDNIRDVMIDMFTPQEVF